MKRNLISLLVVLMLICVSAVADEPQWSYDSGNMYLKVAGTLSGDVTIPAEVDGYPVNAIKYNAFQSNNEITSLTMPDTLRAIQNGAISWMDGLTQVTLNDGLEYIGSNFRNCNALTKLTIPASVRIVEGAIGSCENLKEITFEGPCPLFLNTDWCFDWLSSDYVIYVPDDQLDAYAAALADANGAAEHLQPSGKYAVMPEGSNEDWFVFDAATGTITGYKEYHAFVEIPATIGGVAVKSIGEDAFRSDYSVYGVIFPEGLERIGAGAFQHAGSLSYVKFPTTLKTIGDDAFFNAQISKINWSEGLEEIGARAFQYGGESILVLPSTVRTIGESAFESAWCQELYLGSQVESIGARAFADSALDYIVFDLHELIDIAPDAFASTQITDLDLPWDSSIENRDAYAALLREQCPDCTVWINNPESGGVAEHPINQAEITTIENGVWLAYHGDQKDLTVWTGYDDIPVTALGDGLFKGNQTIRSFYPHHCGWFTTIGNEAFADSSVEYVELFPSITTIGAEAFRNCTNITALTLPESLTTIGAGALKGCTGITELTLPESLTTIGAGAFKDCTGITELTLPASLTSIGEGALDGCEKLATLTVLCDPAILPEDLLAECFAHTQIYAAPNATNEQVRLLSKLAQRPWYAPVSRVGEPVNDLVEMPYAQLPGDDFWYDEEYRRLDSYRGYELNLYLPREVGGVQLTMIGGSMMNRASYGDNFDVELPVRSLVIPETYTEIPMYAFQNCDTLETVICYAPIENLADNLFDGCTSLREVVFVNGVRNIGRYVFSDCPALETVYLGQNVENISEYAFLNVNGGESFALASCITDPAQLPDVEALLMAVKSDPMPIPEPTATPAPAMPVGEEGAPFLGTWRADTMVMEGLTLNAAEMGLVMEFTLTDDGVVAMYDGETTEYGTWTVVDGAAYIDDTMLTLTEDGKLCTEEDGAKLFFVAGDGAQAPSTGDGTSAAPATLPAGDASVFLGTWRADTMVMDGLTLSMADIGLVMEFTLTEDGTVAMYDGETTEYGTWTFESGAANLDGALLMLTTDGKLCLEEDGVMMYFVAAEPTEQPAAPSEPSGSAASGNQDRLEKKYVCTSAEASGFTMPASTLGGEYSLTFHADGTVDFVIVGTSLPALTWTQGTVQTDAGEAEAYFVDYYGTPLAAVWTEAGFDMNYMDAMLMHFVLAE
ncbi:MAG: leucine-rich repeat domain-containing protein [Clostridiales bacterium]|nr:leucine-rich repeat domain-containing protein [Clostridiales bacterium]